MRVCRVIGHVVASSKHPSLSGQKIMVVRPEDEEDGALQVAVDGVQAGVGSKVLVVQSGAAGAEVTGAERPPCRSVIVGIIDEEVAE